MLHCRPGFFIVAALLVGIVASLPLTLDDAIVDLISLPTGHLYPLVGGVGRSLSERPVQRPVHGNLIRYPIDTYDPWVGVSLAEKQNGAVSPLPADTANQQLRLAAREQLARQLLQQPVVIGPDRPNPVERSIAFATVGALTFERPVYLRVLALILILLIAATTAGAVLLRPLQGLIIGAGSIVIGVWGVRTVLVPGSPPDTTAADLSLSIIILVLLGAILTRLLLFFRERAQLPWSTAWRFEPVIETPPASVGTASR